MLNSFFMYKFDVILFSFLIINTFFDREYGSDVELIKYGSNTELIEYGNAFNATHSKQF